MKGRLLHSIRRRVRRSLVDKRAWKTAHLHLFTSVEPGYLYFEKDNLWVVERMHESRELRIRRSMLAILEGRVIYPVGKREEFPTWPGQPQKLPVRTEAEVDCGDVGEVLEIG